MKIINSLTKFTKYHHILSRDCVEFKDILYNRDYTVNCKIYWYYLGSSSDFSLSGDIVDILEKEYQKLKRGEKLKRILE
jgi:hypothetical protein